MSNVPQVNGNLNFMENGKMDLFGNGNAVSMHVSTIDEEAKKVAVREYNKAVSTVENAVKQKYDKELKKAEEITEKMQSMEIMPSGMYILCRPYATNPYQKVEIEGGIIVPIYDGIFKNPDTGEMDTEEQLTIVANVIEVGPLCKYVQPGDDIYYRKHQGIPVPFFRQGFEVVAETQVQVIINEGLKERFKTINESK